MSVEAITAALPRRGLTPTQKLVLIGIANHDGDGGAWPSVATLSNYAECSTRQVQRAIADLVELGLVERHINEGGTKAMRDHMRPNLYVLHLADPVTPVSPPDLDVTPPPDLDVTPPVTPVSPEPSLNRPGEPSVPPMVPHGPTSLAMVDGRFDMFWARYPRKLGKPAAERSFKTAMGKTDHESVLAGLDRWIIYWEIQDRPEFVPHPTTWLNQERWNDDPPQPPRPKAAGLNALANVMNRRQAR